jgi:N utilization substance protein B
VAKTTDRRRSREMALQVLYQMEHGNVDAEEALDLFADNFDAPPRQLDYTRNLVIGISKHAPEIDDALSNVSRRWKLKRMARVDRNILRLAAYEIMFSQGKVPVKVAINEAVELAKRFGGDESPSFVNAVLDNLLGAQDQEVG